MIGGGTVPVDLVAISLWIPVTRCHEQVPGTGYCEKLTNYRRSFRDNSILFYAKIISFSGVGWEEVLNCWLTDLRPE